MVELVDHGATPGVFRQAHLTNSDPETSELAEFVIEGFDKEKQYDPGNYCLQMKSENRMRRIRRKKKAYNL